MNRGEGIAFSGEHSSSSYYQVKPKVLQSNQNS